MQGTQVRNLVWEDATCHRAANSMLHNKRSQHKEKPPHGNYRVAPALPTKESQWSAMKTQCSQKLKKNFFKNYHMIQQFHSGQKKWKHQLEKICVALCTLWDFPVGLVVKNLPANVARYAGLIPGLRRSPGEGNSNPLPVFLPEKCHGQRRLSGYSPWGCKKSRRWLSN